MLKVEWISSGRAGPDHSLSRIPPSDGPDGPSQTLKMSWPTSVSKTMKWRLREHKSHMGDQTPSEDINKLSPSKNQLNHKIK